MHIDYLATNGHEKYGQ